MSKCNSVIFEGLGLDTLKEQTKHYRTYVSHEEESEISPELQRRFDHGHKCEVNK